MAEKGEIMERKALGKGISALIPEKGNRVEEVSDRIADIEVSRVSPSPYQPRVFFKQEKLDELVESIKKKGIVQPLLVREAAEGKYELIAGERRLRAVKNSSVAENSRPERSSCNPGLAERAKMRSRGASMITMKTVWLV